MKRFVSVLFASLLAVPVAHANQIGENMNQGYGWYLNYDWLDQVVNQTPVRDGACPEVDTDRYRDGFRTAMQTSFYGNVSASISRWFPHPELWASFSVGPMVNNFGIISSNITSLSQVQAEKAKKLPLTVQELSKWKVKDSAYWESQGGLAFYMGAGIDPVSVGVFAVATGGWANYLEKTGEDKVYVERAKKYVKSVDVGGGVSLLSVGAETEVEKANGFNYEFTLNNSAAQEAFERFMAGDTTKAYELSQIEGSGAKKIADTSLTKFGRSFGVSLSTPFIPVISLRSSTGKDYNHEEELSIWDEHVVKDYGVYTKQSSSRFGGLHTKKATSFKGGATTTDVGTGTDKKTTSVFYGQFKHAYQADWGQEGRLRGQVDYALDISGTKGMPETCVRVPDTDGSLGYNQVILQMNLSDQYMREIVGMGTSGPSFLAKLEYQATAMDAQARRDADCDSPYDHNNQAANPACSRPSVSSGFSTIRKAAAQIKASVGKNKNAFSQAMANFGGAVWSNPAIFRVFLEKGRNCGMDFSLEVSGQRLSRFNRASHYDYNDRCVN